MQMDKIKERILHILAENNLSVNSASTLLGMPQRTINRQLNEGGTVSTALLRAIHKEFPEYSLEWILDGKGEILNSRECGAENPVPYYESLPLSAGVRTAYGDCAEKPDSYMNIPGVNVEFLFPVVGNSMQPEINAGDIVGVSRVELPDSIENDRIYMIVTRDERMIKRCRRHESDDRLLRCLSPNYPEFTIQKEDVIAIYSVDVRISKV